MTKPERILFEVFTIILVLELTFIVGMVFGMQRGYEIAVERYEVASR